MLKHALLVGALLAGTSLPALADTPDRATAVATLAQFFNSADVCSLFISRAKLEAYSTAAHPADDPMFNIDVFRATQDLYKQQKDWTKDETDAYCKTAAETARKLGVNLN